MLAIMVILTPIFLLMWLAESDIEGETIAKAIIWILMPLLLPFIAIDLFSKHLERRNEELINDKS